MISIVFPWSLPFPHFELLQENDSLLVGGQEFAGESIDLFLQEKMHFLGLQVSVPTDLLLQPVLQGLDLEVEQIVLLASRSTSCLMVLRCWISSTVFSIDWLLRAVNRFIICKKMLSWMPLSFSKDSIFRISRFRLKAFFRSVISFFS